MNRYILQKKPLTANWSFQLVEIMPVIPQEYQDVTNKISLCDRRLEKKEEEFVLEWVLQGVRKSQSVFGETKVRMWDKFYEVKRKMLVSRGGVRWKFPLWRMVITWSFEVNYLGSKTVILLSWEVGCTTAYIILTGKRVCWRCEKICSSLVTQSKALLPVYQPRASWCLIIYQSLLPLSHWGTVMLTLILFTRK